MQSDSGSRRKQLKPAKLDAVLPESSKSATQNEIKAEAQPEQSVEAISVEIPKSSTFGPFPATLTTEDSESVVKNWNKNVSLANDRMQQTGGIEDNHFLRIVYADFQLTDKNGSEHSFLVEDELHRQWISQLKFAKSTDESNCRLIFRCHKELFLTVTKTVDAIGDLCALFDLPQEENGIAVKTATAVPVREKKFVCANCSTGFSTKTTLDAHQKFYCHSVPVSRETNQSNNTPSPNTESNNGQTASTPKRPRISPSALLARAPPLMGQHPTMIPAFLGFPGMLPNPTLSAPAAQSEPLSSSSNTILLPVAYHGDETGVRLMGRPQTIIPVAIPKTEGFSFPSQNLMIEKEWLPRNVTFTPSVQLQNVDHARSSAFSIRLVAQSLGGSCTVQDVTRPQSRQSSLTNKDRSSADGKRKAEPLDLTLNVTTAKSQTSSPASQKATQSTKFVCERCGIPFSSLNTLEGHQLYYCKPTPSTEPTATIATNSENGTEESRCTSAKSDRSDDQSVSISARTSPELRCAHCDYTAANNSQLVQHARTVHAVVQGYLCQLCGYRGYSVRGMKSHMKTHCQSDSKAEVDQLLDTQTVHFTGDDDFSGKNGSNGSSPKTTDSPVACEHCASKFSSFVDLDLHECPSACKTPELQRKTSGSTNHVCQFCSYSSPYKGNVKRHAVLVHKTDSAANRVE